MAPVRGRVLTDVHARRSHVRRAHRRTRIRHRSPTGWPRSAAPRPARRRGGARVRCSASSCSPGRSATVAVLAWLFGIQLIVTGVLQFVSAASDVGRDRAAGCCPACSGTLSILVGLLCLRTPLQTALVLGLLIGIAWVVGGVVRIVQGILVAEASPGHGAPRWWRIAGGVLWVLAGGLVLDFPSAEPRGPRVDPRHRAPARGSLPHRCRAHDPPLASVRSPPRPPTPPHQLTTRSSGAPGQGRPLISTL